MLCNVQKVRARPITDSFILHQHQQTWELAELSAEEYPTEHGRFWCWRLWTFEVDVLRLVSCKNVAVRGWDNSQNTQPRDLTWNVLGSKWMVWGLVCICGDGDGDGSHHTNHVLTSIPILVQQQ